MIKVSIAQTDAILGDKEKNLQCLENYCYRAKENDAQIICFPELATTGYSPSLLGEQYYSLSETENEQTDKLFSQLSSKLNLVIICGFIERDDTTGKIYNSAGIWIPNRENWLAVYRKMHLFDNEKRWFIPGDSLPVFDIGICRIGIMICYDAGFPEVARILATKQADILFMPSAWSKQDKDIWYINTPCRALENTTHLVAVNRWGNKGDINLFGGSRIIDPRGRVIANASEKAEDTLCYEIDLTMQKEIRKSLKYLTDKKPSYMPYL
ncbi:nitrilase-related carbon-nitrogen hydrolase [Arsenophonus nasoniae]|uniref:Nitrilase-related carbon-nitrogen hydrolase n=1 Tax=Arsenophonus nasoniae TaxID=638 RepID=A0AA95GX57_9GAMM|nr:nitrilase-related carbon-nitrogen hydrolase [Arsenophonus nasoniae]WGM01817.1 nitrilase-related carbon-nitrogen hydrolase [Arsenophonus nasoniae]